MCHGDTLGKENEMREIDNMNDTTDVSEETEEKRKSRFSSSDLFDMGLIFAKIALIVFMGVGGCFAMVKCIMLLNKGITHLDEIRLQSSISAGIITDKEIINGHTKSSGGIVYYGGKVGYSFNNNKSYVPTVYRIHISAEFEYNGETHQGSNYFDVSEDVYNSYNVGDYFDSKDLLDSSEQLDNDSSLVNPEN